MYAQIIFSTDACTNYKLVSFKGEKEKKKEGLGSISLLKFNEWQHHLRQFVRSTLSLCVDQASMILLKFMLQTNFFFFLYKNYTDIST